MPKRRRTSNGETEPTGSRRKKKTGRDRTINRTTAGGGTGTSTASSFSTIQQAGIDYGALSSNVRLMVHGFALANGLSEQQAFTGMKKHLAW